MFKKLSLGLLLALGIAFGAQAQGTVPQEFINAQTGTTYTFVPRDCSKLVTLNNASAVAVTLPQAGVTLFPGCFIDVQGIGAGLVTITPTTSTIDGATTKLVSFGGSIRITTDGVNYFTQPGNSPLQGINGVLGTKTLSFSTTAPGNIGNTTPSAFIGIRLTDGLLYYFPAWR